MQSSKTDPEALEQGLLVELAVYSPGKHHTLSGQGVKINKEAEQMFENIGWIVEAKINEGKREEFESVMREIVEETLKEGGTLNYQYYVSDQGDVLVYERFTDVASANIHVDNWDNFAERWVAAARPTRMVHLGELPQELRQRHAALAPLWLKPLGGFAR